MNQDNQNRDIRAMISRRSLASFTLIELLVVIAVILILVGISLKMLSVVTRKAGVSRTLYVLEQTRNALEAYYVAVGSYPNTSEIIYKRSVGQNSTAFDISSQLADAEIRGVSFYLGYDTSNPRYATWRKFVMEVSPAVIAQVAKTNLLFGKPGFDTITTTNKTDAIADAWSRWLIYRPNANCDGYVLFSLGPDGIPNTADDLGVSQNE